MRYKTLKTLRLDSIGEYQAVPKNPTLNLHSPVSAMLNTFCGIEPLMVVRHSQIDDIIVRMQKHPSKYALVKDHHSEVIGVLSYADLCSRKVLMTCERKGIRRAELTAEDMMIPREKLQGIRHQELQGSTVGALLQTMQQLNNEYAFVIDEREHLCGVICTRDILQALNVSPHASITAHSFGDIFNIIHNHAEPT